MFYGRVSRYVYVLETGEVKEILQGDGGEQGDALMPELFALGLDDALKEISGTLQEGELVFAYLDDVYLLVDRDRARGAFDEAERPQRRSVRKLRAATNVSCPARGHQKPQKPPRAGEKDSKPRQPPLHVHLPRGRRPGARAHPLVAGRHRAGGAASGGQPRAHGTRRCVRPKPEPC